MDGTQGAKLDVEADDRPVMIRLTDVHKTYTLGQTPLGRLREALGYGHSARLPEHRAVDGVSLTIRKGETVGLIGANGAGKSTLLQMITGTLKPTSGTIETNGRIAALLELGAGFNPQWTGRKNAEFQCVLQGVPAAEIPDRLHAIEAFADIGAYFHQPAVTYSSGMLVRVAFAASVATAPDILIVDEALAVGDVKFQNKCYRRFEELQNAGCTILFVTHSTELVKKFCTYCYVLSAGRVIFEGAPAEGEKRYLELMYGRPSSDGASADRKLPLEKNSQPEAVADGIEAVDLPADPSLRPHYNAAQTKVGKGFIEVLDYKLADSNGREHDLNVQPDAPTRISVWIKANRNVEQPYVGWIVKDLNDVHLHGSNTVRCGLKLAPMSPGENRLVTIDLELRLGTGHFFIDLGVGEYGSGGYDVGDWLVSAIHFAVSEKQSFFGPVDFKSRVSVATGIPARATKSIVGPATLTGDSPAATAPEMPRKLPS